MAFGDCAEDVEELLAEAGDMDEQVSLSSARADYWNVSASTSSTTPSEGLRVLSAPGWPPVIGFSPSAGPRPG